MTGSALFAATLVVGMVGVFAAGYLGWDLYLNWWKRR